MKYDELSEEQKKQFKDKLVKEVGQIAPEKIPTFYDLWSERMSEWKSEQASGVSVEHRIDNIFSRL